MTLNVLKEFNWVDIFVIILLLRICYVSLKNGFLLEFFKLLGTVAAIYCAMHYYTRVSGSIGALMKLGKNGQLAIFDFLSFIVLALLGYAVFWVIRELIARLFKAEAVPTLAKWGGLVVGVARAFLFLSFVLFALYLSPVDYMHDSIPASYSGKKIIQVAPNLYVGLWESVFSKFMTGEKMNETVRQVQGKASL
ncbi:MAG TPA: CvpA family protein [Patescibacteria group bacterium]|nr:CvpA family protein [Patescibacteria group bacterium]